jgi:hypothetical protein
MWSGTTFPGVSLISYLAVRGGASVAPMTCDCRCLRTLNLLRQAETNMETPLHEAEIYNWKVILHFNLKTDFCF